MNSRLFVATALLALAPLSLAPLAARAQAVATKPAEVQGGTYAVEPLHTRILVSVSHLGFTNYFGELTGASGTLTLDPKTPSATTFAIKAPLASIGTTNPKLDGELKSPQWFDATKYPDITFTSSKVTPTGGNTATVTGDLTLHGVTRPITLHVHFNGAGTNPLDKKYTAGFDASGAFSRKEFGVTTYEPLIGDTLTLNISAAFEKQG